MQIKKAQFNLPFLKIALMGQAGAGKTLTALKLADGLKGEKRILVIDTDPIPGSEAYALPQGKFDFDIFRPESVSDLIDAIPEIDLNKYGVLVLDTITWVWRKVQDADSLKRTSIGKPQFGEWQFIKRTYRDVLMPLATMPIHAIITGREGKEYAQSTNDKGQQELTQVGVRMLAEAETPYEFNLWIALKQVRQSLDERVPQTHLAEILRDRTGILSGQIFENLDIDDLKPIIQVLTRGGVGEIVNETDEAIKNLEIFERDKVKLEKAEQKSAALRMEFEAKFYKAKSLDELAEYGLQLGKSSRSLTEKDREVLKNLYEVLMTSLKNEKEGVK